MKIDRPKKRQRFPKQLLLPAEHGSWAWLLVSYVVGVGVAGQFSFAIFLVLVGGLAAFLWRQPTTALIRLRQGRGRQSHYPLAMKLFLSLGGIALGALIGLLWLGHWSFLWLLLPLSLLFVIHLAVARQGGNGRYLWLELLGAIGLALMAPAAMVVSLQNDFYQMVWVWLLMALQNGLGVFYVRLRIADTHKRPSARPPILWIHLIGMGIILIATLFQWIPLFSSLPFIGFFARAVWVAQKPRPVANMKRFGFAEVGIELLSGLLIVGSYYV